MQRWNSSNPKWHASRFRTWAIFLLSCAAVGRGSQKRLKIIAGAFGKSSVTFKIEAGRAKFDYVNGRRAAWITKIGCIKLADVTPDNVKRAGGNPLKQRRARITYNSIRRLSNLRRVADVLKVFQTQRRLALLQQPC